MRRAAALFVCGTAFWVGLSVAGCPALNADLDFEFNVETALILPPPGEEPLFSSVPIFEEIAGRVGSHAPAICAFSDGELLAAWFSYAGPEELDGAAIYAARRPAGASEWNAAALLVDRPEADANPVLFAQGNRVWFFQAVVPLGWSSARVEWRTSDDRGHTWGDWRMLDGPPGTNVRFPPIRVRGDDLLLPAYDDLLQRSLIFGSADGLTWRQRGSLQTALPYQNLQPSLVELESGRILAVMRNRGQGWLWASASDDQGATWAAPIDGGFPNPGSPACLLRLGSRNLLLIFNDSPTLRRPLSAALSADEGRSWSAPRVLVDGFGEYAYPSAVQTSDGVIHIVYSHERRQIGHVMVNEAWLLE